jgi:hypothetical protein
MAGECHWALYWAKIIMRSVDAVSERQRCELQSHCHSCKRSELQPRCHGTAYEKVRSTEPDDRRKMSPTGTAGEWCATLVLQLTGSTEPTSSARALSRTAPYCEPQATTTMTTMMITTVTKKDRRVAAYIIISYKSGGATCISVLRSARLLMMAAHAGHICTC